MSWTGWVELVGPLSVAVALMIMGRLTRRFAKAAGHSRWYLGFFLAALLVVLGVVARLLNLTQSAGDLNFIVDDANRILLYHGLPALGITLGVVIAWRYWSWLLAERN